MKYDVSVIILTYNSDWQKLRRTIESVVLQRDINEEIIIADDGSSVRWDNEIKSFCHQCGYSDLKIVNSEQNGGTVKNLFNGVKEASGDYIKPIAAGDYLYSDDTLKKWFLFMKQNNAKISFGDAVYYQESNDDYKIVKTVNHPMQLSLYRKEAGRRKMFVNYLLANDTVLGAALMTEKTLMQHYLNEIVGKVKFAEDYMVRLAVFDGEKLDYFQDKVIWYEYGTGVSTGANDKWKKLLLCDFEATDEIISNRSVFIDSNASVLSGVFRKKGKIKKILKAACFPDYLIERRRNSSNPEYTPVDADINILYEIVKGKYNAGNNS